ASAVAVILFLAIIPVMIYNIRRFQQQEAQR
ncbi:MAG: sugar ABC transporter permease, partial [Chloroflexota bacterium]